MDKIINLNDKALKISAYSNNIVRIRVSKDFEPSLFERYNIYHKPEECGEELENGVKVGDLTVTYENGQIVFSTKNITRTIVIGEDNEGMRKYMDEALGNLRPEYKQIIGDEAKRNYGTVEFEKDPKYITISTEGEKFYGLGEASDDRLILNGRVYLQRVVYQRNEIPIPFMMTKAGYGILCNSTFWHGIDVCARNENEIIWYLPDGDLDFMIFAGETLSDVLERFTFVTGRPMLMPKWAYGLTFTEQYHADQFEVMHTAEKFREKNLPCDMISLEPGWMSKRYDFSVNKKWNVEKFFINDWARSNNPNKTHSGFFTSALKRYGYKVQLWLCSTHDFSAHEEQMAGNTAECDIPAWFDHLRAFVNDGANSFKVDPCHVCDSADEGRVYFNGKSEPEMHNLMQTLCVKEMYQGARAHTGKRPMHHFCGGFTSTGAYSAATTGDNGGGHRSMTWMLNLGLSAYSNISCDMDIHKKETIHYGFFMPWSQLNAWSGFQHPWWAGHEMEEIFTYYDKLHYHLIPYLYSTAIDCYNTGVPVCRAMPLMFNDKESENVTNQYMFGDALLVGAFDNNIYLPKGSKWIDYWTGKVYAGGKRIDYAVPENRGGALFVKGGSIIPTADGLQYIDGSDIENITFEIFPENISTYIFKEDDGITCEYEDGKTAYTEVTCNKGDEGCFINISGRTGEFTGMKDTRKYSVKVFSKTKPTSVKVNGKRVKFTYENNFVSYTFGASGKSEIKY
ncbi:MAG: DUF5110 domain-containing protein [Clostridia bacterium]|nr:DUF5110 domain-containing protein [Clostridia bacterium]